MIRTAATLIVFLALFTGAAGAAADAPPRIADERILLRTNRGDLVLALYPDVAPRHVQQILALVRLGVYDSTWFHRVDPTFVAQLTDAANRLRPLTPEQQSALQRIPAELSTTLRHRAGTLSMARYDDDMDSAESSFSILLQPAPHLDGRYTIFGELDRGADVLQAIASAPRNGVAPVDRIVVEAAVVLTAAEVAQREEAGELLDALSYEPAAPADEIHAAASADTPQAASPIVPIGLALMIATSGVAFLAAGRWPPQRAAAFALLTVLIGAFLLLRELAPRASHEPLLAMGVFFALVGVFKLMNRFEAAARS
jgi:peptidylprolyl isomerase